VVIRLARRPWWAVVGVAGSRDAGEVASVPSMPGTYAQTYELRRLDVTVVVTADAYFSRET
jgi:hypothetical protein